jgi:MYXO-CTERM domain-containing protein
MNKGALSVAALAALVSWTLASDAAAWCRMTTEGGAQVGGSPCVERGAPLEWNNPCLSYAIDARGSEWMDLADIEAAVDASFATWANADCDGDTPNLIFKPLQASTCRRAEFNTTGNVNTIAFLDPWKDPCADQDDPSYDPNAFAVTIVWHNTSTGEILDADMMVNDLMATRFNAGGPYANCPDTGCAPGTPGEADLANIVTHEAGHFIGIGHSEVESATMFASAERQSVEKRTLDPDDIEAVCTIYSPDSGNLDQSCNATPMGGLELNCETDDQGNPLSCDEPAAAPSSGGCSAFRVSSPSDAPWGALMLALFGLTVLRRRAARS